jgi:hypothetical protein
MLITDLVLVLHHVAVYKKQYWSFLIRGENNFLCNEFRVRIAFFLTFFIFLSVSVKFVKHKTRDMMLVDSK